MSRTLTTAVDNALQSGNIPSLLFIELEFASGTVRLCNASYDIPWNGYTWLGAGLVGKINPVEEGAELQMYGVSMQLSGVPSSMIAVALAESYQGRPARIWYAPLDDNYNVLADPVGAFTYRMDSMSIELGESGTITLSAESRLTDWDRPHISRYTHEDQQLKSPGDRIFEFVPQMVEKQLIWGRQ